MEKTSKISKDRKNDILWEIRGILLVSAGILILLSNYTDTIGLVGAFFRKNLRGFSGQTSLVIPIALMVLGANVIYKKQKPKATPRVFGLSILFLVATLVSHIRLHIDISSKFNFLERLRQTADLGLLGEGGGILGESLATIIAGTFGITGTYIVAGTFFLIGLILVTGWSISKAVTRLKTWQKNKEKDKSTPKAEDIKVLNFSHNLEDPSPPEGEEQEKVETREVLDEDKPLAVNINDNTNDEYKLPPISLLRSGGDGNMGMSEKELLLNAQKLEDTLTSFSIKAKVAQVSCGPSITRFEVHPSPGVKVSRIVNLADDLALSLAAQDVRIEAPIPGKAALGIEVPNKKKVLVSLRDIIDTTKFNKSKSTLSFALGKDVAGNPVISDLAEMPHLLVAGATGSGKSVCINTIITSILYKACPNEVRLVMIDPKVVELADYDDIPHLLTPVVTDAKKAASALAWLVIEMEKRYDTFSKKGVRDITGYNEQNPDDKMPKIVIIIDELADLMMVSPREVEDNICRLAQMARAAGMHLVIATQRPSVDVITGLIKANIPSRLSFAVSSQVDSRTILDMAGAEKLLGKGDMLFLPVGANKPVRIQGAYISQREVEQLVTYIKSQGTADYKKKLEDFTNFDREIEQNEVDDLFEEAVMVVFDSGRASTSYLQRRLNIGYNRAARLMDQMEERNIISPPDGNKPRDILMTRDQFEKNFT